MRLRTEEEVGMFILLKIAVKILPNAVYRYIFFFLLFLKENRNITGFAKCQKNITKTKVFLSCTPKEEQLNIE